MTANGVSADGSWAGNHGCPGRRRHVGKKHKSADGGRKAGDGSRRAGCHHGVDMWRKLVFHLADVSGRTERYGPGCHNRSKWAATGAKGSNRNWERSFLTGEPSALERVEVAPNMKPGHKRVGQGGAWKPGMWAKRPECLLWVGKHT